MDVIKFLKERESTFVALITATSYLIVFLHEVGFSYFYSYPISLISIDISTMLFGLFFCSLLYAVLYFVYSSLMKGIDKYGILWYGLVSAITNRFHYWLITLLLYFILPIPPYYLFFACAFVLVLDYSFYSPNIFKTKRKAYINKLKENIYKREEEKGKVEIKNDFFSLFCMSFTIGILISCYGYSNAKEMKSFFVFEKDKQRYAIIKKYYSYIVAI